MSREAYWTANDTFTWLLSLRPLKSLSPKLRDTAKPAILLVRPHTAAMAKPSLRIQELEKCKAAQHVHVEIGALVNCTCLFSFCWPGFRQISPRMQSWSQPVTGRLQGTMSTRSVHLGAWPLSPCPSWISWRHSSRCVVGSAWIRGETLRHVHPKNHKNIWCTTCGPYCWYAALVILRSFMALHSANKDPPKHASDAGDADASPDGVSNITVFTMSKGWPGATHLLWARTSETSRVWIPGRLAVPPTSNMFPKSFPRRLMLLCSRKLAITSSGKVSPAKAAVDLISKSSSPHMKPFSRSLWSTSELLVVVATVPVFKRCSSTLKSCATQADRSLALSATAQEPAPLAFSSGDWAFKTSTICEVKAAPPIRPWALQWGKGYPSSTGVTRVPSSPISITSAVESPAPKVAKNVELNMQTEVRLPRHFSNKNSQSSSRALRREEIGRDTINWRSSDPPRISFQKASLTKLSRKLPGVRSCLKHLSLKSPVSPALKVCCPQSTTVVIYPTQLMWAPVCAAYFPWPRCQRKRGWSFSTP